MLRRRFERGWRSVRSRFTGYLENARVPMQLDVAFGDVVHPPPEIAVFPTLLEFPAPALSVYPRETVIAEKFQAMVFLGTVNSRMKDFYDIWLLSRQFDFEGAALAEAVSRTFSNRQTEIELGPVALSSTFAEADSPGRQWQAFVRKSLLAEAPATLRDAVDHLRGFLLPLARAVDDGGLFEGHWVAPGPWR